MRVASHIERVPDNWTFKDDGVAAGFDSHVREQLPWYDLVTEAVVQISRHYIGEGGLVYDIGASTGNIGRALSPVLRDRNANLVSIEESSEMAELWSAPGELVVTNALAHPYQRFDLAVCMLCLIFNSPSDSAALLHVLKRNVAPGGAIVVVERMLPPDGYLSIVTSRLTLHAKRMAGATGEEIVTKELSLAGAQRPLDPALLAELGAVEWFRYGDFAGYVIEGASW